jgi:hypothetical protein
MKDSDTEVKKHSAVQKILQHPANRREPETEESGKPYEDARSRDNFNLEFRFCDGKREFFSLVGLEAEFDPGQDGDTLTLRFARADVIVTGLALLSLYEKLLDQRARFIPQNTEAQRGLLPAEESYVEQIEITRKEH